MSAFSYKLEHRAGKRHGNADGLSRMCGLNNCICEPVRQLELREVGEDNHEVIYAESRTDNEESEKYLVPPDEAEAELEHRIKAKPKKKIRSRHVNFDKAVRGVTDSEADAIPGVTDDDNVQMTCAKKASRSKRNTAKKEQCHYDSRQESSDEEAAQSKPVVTVQRVKVQTVSQETQTGDEVHQQHDKTERDVFARAVAVGSLWTREEMIDAQLDDVDIAPVMKAKQEGEAKPSKDKLQGITRAARFYFLFWDRLMLIDGVLHLQWESPDARKKRNKLVLPFKYRDVVMMHLHDSNYAGHLAGRRTQEHVTSRYFWYKVRDDIMRYLRTCDKCQRRKRPGRTPHAAMMTKEIGEPFERIAMDICGRMTKTHEGNQYVLVISDYFSKYTIAVPLNDKTSRSVAEALCTHWVSFFGMPDVIHTDRGGEFENNVLHELCERFGTTKTRTVAYNPRSDGQVERWNATFTQIINTICEDKEEWDEYLAFARMAYNSTVHSTTGETPNMIIMGRQIRLPLDVMTTINPKYDQIAHSDYVRALEEDMRECYIRVRDRTRKAAQCQKSFYDRKKHENVYKSEDLVMMKVMAYDPHRRKLQDRYTGTWAIIESIPGHCYRVQKDEFSRPEIVHHDRLKPYRARTPAEHNTDWVARVRDRFAAIRGQEPLPRIMPSSGEETGLYDTEEELVLNARPESEHDDASSADDELMSDDAEQEVTATKMKQVPVTPSQEGESTSNTPVQSAAGELVADDGNSVEQTDSGSRQDGVMRTDGIESSEEYTVPKYPWHRKYPPPQSADSSSDESVHLADSQFMLRDPTPPRSQRYNLRRKPKPKPTYSP